MMCRGRSLRKAKGAGRGRARFIPAAWLDRNVATVTATPVGAASEGGSARAAIVE